MTTPSLWVGGFGHSLQAHHIARAFESRIGKIKEVEIKENKAPGKAPYAFVEFLNDGDAERAIELNGQVIYGTKYKVYVSRRGREHLREPRSPTPPRDRKRLRICETGASTAEDGEIQRRDPSPMRPNEASAEFHTTINTISPDLFRHSGSREDSVQSESRTGTGSGSSRSSSRSDESRSSRSRSSSRRSDESRSSHSRSSSPSGSVKSSISQLSALTDEASTAHSERACSPLSILDELDLDF